MGVLVNETYDLAGGITVPKIGYGCYNPRCDHNREIFGLALETGYRYFDTAYIYGTERDLGLAIKDAGIPRSELTISTKAWHDQLGYERTKTACYKSLENLGLDYIDIYLIHWPRHDVECDWRTMDLEAWRAMCELKEEGVIRGIGVSNFLPHHLQNIIENSDVVPVIDQLELHPGYCQEAAVAYCKEHGIQPQAWGPLGRGRALDNTYINELAAKYGKSPAQICIRYLLQRGIMPVVKSSSAERMRANTEVFDFGLTEEEVSIISCMPQEGWMGEHPDFKIPTKSSE